MSRPARMRRASRWCALGLTAVYAALALASGMDRMAQFRPGIAGRAPGPFQTFAARQLALDALSANRPDAAIGFARAAVRRDPADAHSSGLLGAALLAAGMPDRARNAFRVSGAQGWREPFTQMYWMSVAFDQGNLRIASQRLDALLRQSPEHAGRRQLLALFEASAEGRAQLGRRLIDAPAWRDGYFRDTYLLPPGEQALRAQVAIGMAGGAGGVRDCALVAPLTLNLASNRAYGLARQVWQAHCAAPGDQAPIADGGFEKALPGRHLTAFDWSWSSDGAVDLVLGPVSGFSGNALTVASSAPARRAFAAQLAVLPAGRYRASWRARIIGGGPARGIALSLSCDPRARRILPADLTDAGAARFAADFAVAPGCDAQWLEFSIGQGSQTATLDDVSITRM